mgnify:CR=1 FL=1
MFSLYSVYPQFYPHVFRTSHIVRGLFFVRDGVPDVPRYGIHMQHANDHSLM